MQQKWLKLLFGLNAASIVRGMRLGMSELVEGSVASFATAHPRQNRIENHNRRLVELIPVVTVGEILGGRKAMILLLVQKYEDGILPFHEALALLSIFMVENPREILEIGTFTGYTTKALAENLRDTIIHTVDLPPDFSPDADRTDGPPKDDLHLIGKRVVGREFKGHPVEERIRQHFGDTATINFKDFGRPTCFFIDGSHTYEYCKQDSEKCFALCDGKGTFLWHDVDDTHPGVVKFVLEWRGLGRNICRIKDTGLAYWKSDGTR